MAQQILFKRGKTLYGSQAEAINALNSLAFVQGEPVIVNYLDSDTSTVRILFAIGITNGTGASCYRLITTFDSYSDLANSLGALSDSLTIHEDSLANGATVGHVYDDGSGDIEFTQGIAKIKEGAVSLSAIEKGAAAGIIGIKSSDLASSDGSAAPSFMSWGEVIQELTANGFLAFRGVQIVGGDSIVADSSQATLKISTDNNLSLTKAADGSLKISLNGEIPGGTGGSVELNTVSGPIKISGTSDAIVTEFSATEPVSFQTPPAIESPVTVGSAGDNSNSQAVATVGYVVNKIDNKLAEFDGMKYMGAFNPNTQTLPAAEAGYTYKISENGNIEGLGEVHSGDMIICSSDNTAEKTPANWDLIEAHDGTIMSSVTGQTEAGNIVVFDNTTGSSVSDSGVKVSELLQKSVKVSAGNGLELSGTNTSGVLGNGDVVVSHAEVTRNDEGTGNVVTGITTNEYGHITSVTFGEAGGNLSLAKEGEFSGDYAGAGYTLGGVKLENDVLTLYSTQLPGTVKVNGSSTELKYLADVIAAKSEDSLGVNEYAVKTSVNSNNVIELSVTIDKIDGGEF